LVAVTVYDVEGDTAVGVPLILPVEGSNDRPAGSVGVIDQEVTSPPLAVGVTVVMALFIVKVKELGLYDTEDGGATVTRSVKVVVAPPPELVAVTV
jgi:hypothetical protein|tara:strand:- start:639 stop:926 length:288 start_codon:yes stop_codon:yes gene_type:complete